MAERKFGVEVQAPLVGYLSQRITYEDDGVEFSLGHLPEGAVVLDVAVIVTTAFDSGTSDLVDVGYTDDKDEFVAGADVSSAGRVFDATTMNASPELQDESEKEIVATYASTGTAPTAGECFVVITYVPRYQDRA